MLLYTSFISPRLKYIIDFTGRELQGYGFELTNDVEIFREFSGNKINYSNERITPDEFWISPHTLLFEKEIRQQNTECFEVNNNKAFFKTEGDFPFDIFAASFYLLSRYEEYLPHQKDMYGRYAHENSLAFKENFLHLPLINIWLQYFIEKLKQKFPSLTFHHSPFTFLPTYDIDEAFCYKHKSAWKTWGGYCRSFLKGDKWEIKERKNVLKGIEEDPYDSLYEIKFLHQLYHHLDAHFFFLVAEKNGRYDKNTSPYNKEWQKQVQNFFEKEYAGSNMPKLYIYAGLHPSWQSGDNPELIKKEMDLLQYEIGVEAKGSRQHFIRFTLPQTFRQLIEAGIHSDYSMGYGSINGFRASVASSFYWYDLEKEEQTQLELFPFCFMDANSFFEQKQTPQQALEEMMKYFEVIKSVNGTMITIWHNTFLGTHRRFAGWKEIYQQFIGSIYSQIPFVRDQIDNEGMDKKYFIY